MIAREYLPDASPDHHPRGQGRPTQDRGAGMTLPRFLDEPPVGEQVTDGEGDVWQRTEDDWCWWMGEAVGWSSYHRTWGHVQTTYGPLRATTDDDRRRVGLPVRDEEASPAQTDAQDAPDHHDRACVCLDCLDAQAQDDAEERGAWERDEAVSWE